MHDKLRKLDERYSELHQKLASEEVYSSPSLSSKYLKEQKEIAPLVNAYREYTRLEHDVSYARELLDGTLDSEMRAMVQEEYENARGRIEEIEREIKVLLLPRDPNDDKNVIIEIRGGAGGEEAALFAADLFRMYSMYSENRKWKIEILNLSETFIKGIKEISFVIEGAGAYSRLKFESGVHRVQRVPDTETTSRLHTSTVTVAVLPEAEDVEIEINDKDLQIDTFRASGAGGQHVNKTESAIRVTHLPSGMSVECQEERSQHKNKERAMKLLRSRLYDLELTRQNSDIAAQRKSQVGTGDRAERIRTYNFPQSRVTDHRIGLTLYRIEAVMNGDLDEIIDALTTADQAEKLRLSGDEDVG